MWPILIAYYSVCVCVHTMVLQVLIITLFIRSQCRVRDTQRVQTIKDLQNLFNVTIYTEGFFPPSPSHTFTPTPSPSHTPFIAQLASQRGYMMALEEETVTRGGVPCSCGWVVSQILMLRWFKPFFLDSCESNCTDFAVWLPSTLRHLDVLVKPPAGADTPSSPEAHMQKTWATARRIDDEGLSLPLLEYHYLYNVWVCCYCCISSNSHHQAANQNRQARSICEWRPAQREKNTMALRKKVVIKLWLILCWWTWTSLTTGHKSKRFFPFLFLEI